MRRRRQICGDWIEGVSPEAVIIWPATVHFRARQSQGFRPVLQTFSRWLSRWPIDDDSAPMQIWQQPRRMKTQPVALHAPWILSPGWNLTDCHKDCLVAAVLHRMFSSRKRVCLVAESEWATQCSGHRQLPIINLSFLVAAAAAAAST